MSNLAFSLDHFRSVVENNKTRFTLDLSNHSVMSILQVYEDHCKKKNARYRHGNAISAMARVEEALNYHFMPLDITDEFYLDARLFFLSVPNSRGKTLANSTINTYFATISSALTWAAKHGAKVSDTYNEFEKPSYSTEQVALTESQIAHIYYFDIDSKETRKKLLAGIEELKMYRYSFSLIRKVIDQFVLGCNLGQRYSDYSHITRDNFDETGTIYRVTQQKTGSKASVNISRYSIDSSIVFEILKKYNYTSPAYGLDNGDANKILHLVCKTIGGEFNREYISTNKVNGELVKTSKKMWELIASHTARRTFVTHCVNDGRMSVSRIQRCTGHKDIKCLNRYSILNDD